MYVWVWLLESEIKNPAAPIFNNRSPVSGDVSRGHRNFKRKNLAGESESSLTPHSAHTVFYL